MPGEVDASHLGSRDPFVGRVLARRFELRSRIGSGAMGHVYRAIDRDDGSTCAVKILRPELLADWSLIKRFHREGRAAQAIDNPHVVRILDFGESDDDLLFIAMEYLSGQTLAAWIEREGKASTSVAIGVLRAIADAICAAHAAGVTHRDLKPDNVVLGPGGRVKVVDFGIARIAEGSRAASEMAANVTIAGSLMGTPLYMSPEAAAREQVGPAADVYALGVIAYELLTGEPPFVHENPMHVVGMHLRVRPPRLRDTLPELPEALDQLVDALMAKDPQDRPSPAGAKSTLDAIADSLGIEVALPIDTLRDVEVPSTIAAMLREGDANSSASTLISPVRSDRTLEDPPRPRVITGERLVPTVLVPPDEPLTAPTPSDSAARRRVVAIAIALTVLVALAVTIALGAGHRGEREDAPTDGPATAPERGSSTKQPVSRVAAPGSRAPDTETITAAETETVTAPDTESVVAPQAEATATPDRATESAASRTKRPRRPAAPRHSMRRAPPRPPLPDEPDLDIARDYQ